MQHACDTTRMCVLCTTKQHWTDAADGKADIARADAICRKAIQTDMPMLNKQGSWEGSLSNKFDRGIALKCPNAVIQEARGNFPDRIDYLMSERLIYFVCPARFFCTIMQQHFQSKLGFPPCPHCCHPHNVSFNSWVKAPRRLIGINEVGYIFSSSWRCKCGTSQLAHVLMCSV